MHTQECCQSEPPALLCISPKDTKNFAIKHNSFGIVRAGSRELIHKRNVNLMKLHLCHRQLPYFGTSGSGEISSSIRSNERFIWKYFANCRVLDKCLFAFVFPVWILFSCILFHLKYCLELSLFHEIVLVVLQIGDMHQN